MRTEKTHGWAVVSKGIINVRTVSDTRRAALVNWLVVDGGMFIGNATTDEEIEDFWYRSKKRGNPPAICTVVTITDGAKPDKPAKGEPNADLSVAVGNERHRCALIADRHGNTLTNGGAINACRKIAASIRGDGP